VAERFPVKDTSIEPGDIVSISNQVAPNNDSLRASAYLEKSQRQYDAKAVGVVSTQPGIELGKEEFKNQSTRPVGIAGRVPVKATNENGAIKPGDYLTTSSIPGYAMKATRSGYTIGRALDSFDSRQGTVMMFLDIGYHQADWQIDLSDSSYNDSLQGTGSSSPNSFIVNQNGSGDILKLQQNESDRFLVRNDGTVQILAQPNDEDPDSPLLVIKSKDSEVFKINLRGDIETQGVIRVKNNSFAGSIETNENGEAEIKFDYHLGTGKPSVQLSIEDENRELILAKLSKFLKDEEGNYLGFLAKAFDAHDGKPATSTILHYIVIAKGADYGTSSSTPALIVVPEENSASTTPVEIIIIENPSAEAPPDPVAVEIAEVKEAPATTTEEFVESTTTPESVSVEEPIIVP
ncbi:MAG: hypothetical protein AAB389_02490, partial [Patescibacteria group bacterium]